MEIRCLLVDSQYLLKRSLNGAKNVATDKFGMIGGLYSFITTIRSLIVKHKINKVVLAWDGENGGYYRYLKDYAYKANRSNKSWYNKIEFDDRQIKLEEEKELSILKQRKRIQAYAEELFFRQLESDKVEADDIIYEYCNRYHDKEDIYIFTNDRDLIQTLKFNITIIFGNIETPINRQNFMMNFDYYYSNSLTIKTICGDVSDNIEGIDGIGVNTLLKHFPDLKFRHLTVNDICKKSKEINEERVKNKKKPYKIFENLLNNKKRLILNNELVNLDNPLLDEDSINQIDDLEFPLSDENRNSKNLYQYMIEDDFLNIYKGTFTNYVKPFYPVIMQEKEFLKKYNKIK